jgi:hypothetical protein
MQLSPAEEVASRSATQEFQNILQDPKVNCSVHKGPPLVPVLSQMNLVHTNQFYIGFFKLHFIIIFPSHLV